SNAGGLGMLGTARWGGGRLANLERLIDRVQELTPQPFGVNFLIPPEFQGDIDPGCFALAARRARLVEFFWGWPDPAVVETINAEGALVSWQVGSREEAEAAASAGADVIVAQGVGAGGACPGYRRSSGAAGRSLGRRRGAGARRREHRDRSSAGGRIGG